MEKDVCYLYGKKEIVTKLVKVFKIKRTGYKKTTIFVKYLYKDGGGSLSMGTDCLAMFLK